MFFEEPINRNSKFWDTPNLVITLIYRQTVKENISKWF